VGEDFEIGSVRGPRRTGLRKERHSKESQMDEGSELGVSPRGLLSLTRFNKNPRAGRRGKNLKQKWWSEGGEGVQDLSTTGGEKGEGEESGHKRKKMAKR